MEKDGKLGGERNLLCANFGNCAELPLYESWFTDMSAQGKHLLSWGLWFSRFARRKPRNYVYRIDLCEKVNGVPSTPPAHNGWSFVCRRDDAFVYRAELEGAPVKKKKPKPAPDAVDVVAELVGEAFGGKKSAPAKKAPEDKAEEAPQAPPFSFDPRKRFASINVQRKIIGALSLLLWALGLLTATVGFVALGGLVQFSWHGFLVGGFGYFLATAVLAVSAAFVTAENLRLRRIHYLYKTRQEEKKPNWQRSRSFSYFVAALCLTLFAFTVFSVAWQRISTNTETLPFAPQSTRAPLPWLEEVDGEMSRVPSTNLQAQYDTNNFISQSANPIAPRQYSARQCNEAPDKSYHPVMESESISCLFLFSAKELFKEIAKAPAGWEQSFAVDGGGQTDQLRAYTNAYGEYYVVARHGKIVLSVKYHGKADQEKLLAAIGDVIGN
ncbi:MAG: DUF2812 domain-containing protein [Clostridium sp.]|jgi:hypothetical protein|nr:DUF2812 domain-containing protein [Clostridium sp.]